MSTALEHAEVAPVEAEVAPNLQDPPPDEALVCTLCGLSACWTAKPARSA